MVIMLFYIEGRITTRRSFFGVCVINIIVSPCFCYFVSSSAIIIRKRIRLPTKSRDRTSRDQKSCIFSTFLSAYIFLQGVSNIPPNRMTLCLIEDPTGSVLIISHLLISAARFFGHLAKHPVEDGLAQIALSPASVQYYRLCSILHLWEYSDLGAHMFFSREH